MIVRFPKSRANVYPKFTFVVVFPSPFTELVVTTTVVARSASSSTSRVAATRNCSATIEVGHHLVTRLCSPENSALLRFFTFLP